MSDTNSTNDQSYNLAPTIPSRGPVSDLFASCVTAVESALADKTPDQRMELLREKQVEVARDYPIQGSIMPGLIQGALEDGILSVKGGETPHETATKICLTPGPKMS